LQEQACELLKLGYIRTREKKLLEVMSKRDTSKDLKQVLEEGTNENKRAALLMTRNDLVLSKAELSLSKDHEDVQSLNEFMVHAKLSGWEESNLACPRGDTNLEASQINKRVVMAFRENGLTPFSRVQHGSVCYVHAPVMLVQYLCYLDPGDPERADPGHYIINISQWMRNNLMPYELWERIFVDEQGGSSIDVLTRILAKSGTPEIQSLTERSFDRTDPSILLNVIFDHFKRFGPALVSRVKVTKSFQDASIHRHIGLIPCNDEFVGYHAMLLVGVRIDNNDQAWFLLQNWWAKKQFVEVDWTWFVDCGASLHLVTSAIDPSHIFGKTGIEMVYTEARDFAVFSASTGRDTGALPTYVGEKNEC
jgi:hypothetical protein